MLRVMRLAVGAAVVLFAGAALAQPPKDADGYFPLKPGTKWTYKVGDQNVEVKVADKTENFNNEVCTKVETLVNGKVVASELYAVRPDGVYRVKVKDDKIDPGIKVLALPAKAGTSWDFKSKVGQQSVSGSFKITNEKDKLKIMDKDVEAVVVEGSELDVAGTKTTVKLWFVKDRGIVKLTYKIQDSESVLELIKFDSPGSSG
jgi:hypothetical protein